MKSRKAQVQRDAVRSGDVLNDTLAERGKGYRRGGGGGIPRYLTIEEVAKLARCEHKAVRKAIHGDELTAYKVAGKWLVLMQDAVTWIESRPAVVELGGDVHGAANRARSGTHAGLVSKLREMDRRGDAMGTPDREGGQPGVGRREGPLR